MTIVSKIHNQITHFLHYAKHHRILISRDTRKVGVRDTIIGWALIALSVVLFKTSVQEMPSSVNFVVQFATGALTLLIASAFTQFNCLVVADPSQSEHREQGGHLTVRERWGLIFIRGLIAVVGYMGFSWARGAFGLVDNSALFGGDAIFYAAIMYFALGQKLRGMQLLGIITATIGVLAVFTFDLETAHWTYGVLAFVAGLLSSLALAIVILLNSVMLQYEPPLRIAFYQCLLGAIIAASALLVSMGTDGLQIFAGIPPMDYFYSACSGAFYAIALLFFFSAFLYTEPIIITVISYSLGPLTLLFDVIVNKVWTVATLELISVGLITIGGILSVFDEYRADKRRSTKGESVPVHPTYRDPLHKQMRRLRRDFKEGKLDMYSYLSHKHEYNKLLFEFAKELEDTDVTSIDILPKEVVFSLKPNNIKLLSDGAARSAPLEALNFGHYEPDEHAVVNHLMHDSDVIFDVGAHIGWYSVNWAKQFPMSAIYAFEPLPVTFGFLQENLKLNSLHNVQAFNFGLMDFEGEIEFHYFRGGSALASPVNLIDHNRTQKITCPVKTLDVIALELGVDRLNFIKCDVEGCELATVKGALTTIERHLPIIMLELYEGWCKRFGYSAVNVSQLLAEFGYHVYKPNGKFLEKATGHFDDSEQYNYIFLHKDRHKDRLDKLTL